MMIVRARCSPLLVCIEALAGSLDCLTMPGYAGMEHGSEGPNPGLPAASRRD